MRNYTNQTAHGRKVYRCQRKGSMYSLLLTICAACSLFVASLLLDLPQAFADAPSVVDFGQASSASNLGHRPIPSNRALFVTKQASGNCEVENRKVKDDSITGFATAHPAWKLDVELTWYFMEPVYERDLCSLQPGAQPVGV